MCSPFSAWLKLETLLQEDYVGIELIVLFRAHIVTFLTMVQNAASVQMIPSIVVNHQQKTTQLEELAHLTKNPDGDTPVTDGMPNVRTTVVI